jgi:hypothetical protein
MSSDKAAIAEVVNLYAAAIDSHGWDLFDAIFTPDVVLDYCHVLAWSDLAAFKRDFAAMHEPTAGHQHFLGVPQIVVEGDRAWALTYGRFNLFRVAVAEKVDDMSQGGAWYDDELVRTPAGWRISRRTARNFWWQGSLPEQGPYKRIVDSFPEAARNGEIGFVNALRRVMGQTAPVVEPAQ